ncbi:MAG: RnfABCDGE type electron transport complex subunit D [Defluviitaleaceae bacterium]|nr:RnfABCDGE type electron transport complex subunit D [Defluviitaleaceae bacterium]
MGKYIVTVAPHMRSGASTDRIMLDVLIALTPTAVAGAYFFGPRAVGMMLVCMGSCVFWEWVFQRAMRRPITINDNSALVTGLLLAMNLPASAPYWMGAAGSAFAIIIVKQLFGGLGQNFVNPALAARAVLMASYPRIMTGGFAAPDAASSATPLMLMKDAAHIPATFDYINALTGNIGGCIGETSALMLLLGAFYLLLRRVISWRIPAAYLGTVFVLALMINRDGMHMGYPLYELLTGGLLLGAFFMATDYATSPVTAKGQLIFGLGCGVITVAIRFYGAYPEGVSYAILLMNLTVPLIERFTRPRIWGRASRK